MNAPFAPGPATVASRATPLKILVVDDSQLVHQAMREKLSALGQQYRLEADHAHSGEEALERIRHAPYDVVFLDVEMPGVDGHEACRRIKAQRPGTRVAMLSSLARLSDREAASRAGCDHYLEKPPKDVVLGAVLRVAELRKQLRIG